MPDPKERSCERLAQLARRAHNVDLFGVLSFQRRISSSLIVVDIAKPGSASSSHAVGHATSLNLCAYTPLGAATAATLSLNRLHVLCFCNYMTN